MSLPNHTQIRTAPHKETANVTLPGQTTRTMKAFLASMLTVAACLLLFAVPGASAAAPQWTVHMTHTPNTFHRGQLATPYYPTGDTYGIEVTNSGDSDTTGPFTFTDTLPDGIELTALKELPFGSHYQCAGDGKPNDFRRASVLSCTTSEDVLHPGDTLVIGLVVSVFDPPSPVVNHFTISGGGAPTVSAEDPTPVADKPPWQVETFEAPTTTEGGADYTAAGGHPYRNRTRFTVPIDDGYNTQEFLKDAIVKLPNGFFGNPAGAPRCDISKVPFFEFSPGLICPKGSIVGTAQIADKGFGGEVRNLYNVIPERGHPAQFAFNVQGTVVSLVVTTLPRTEAYGLTVGSRDITRLDFGSADGQVTAVNIVFNGIVSNDTDAPFLTNPVDCSDSNPLWKVTADSWENPGRQLPLGVPDLSDPNWKVKTISAPPVTGCDDPELASQFNKTTMDVKPLQGGGSVQADQPAGLAVDLDFPQANDPTDLNTTFDASLLQAPEPKDITVNLPAGLAISPSSATGLGACSDLASDPAGDQVHYDTTAPVACPAASKIGTVTATTPLVASHDPVTDAITGADPIPGDVYLLKPHPGDLSSSGNQDGTFRLLLQLDYPRYGLNFKLPGTAVADKNTGQLTTTFADNPQLPSKHLTVALKSGPRAPLATPTTCGSFQTTSNMVPWGAPQIPNANPTSTFNVNSGPNGSACANSPGARPFSPSLGAGSGNASAGASTPFYLKIARSDGEQELSSVDVTLPKGLTAKLAGIPYCSDAAIVSASNRTGAAELASSSCPSASQVGSVIVGAGPGSDPYYTEGKAYLSGPYKGAPLSLAFITPAVAGPFDLGDVVVRAALQVDPETAQVTVKTDPLPQILDGVPLRIRSLVTKIDRSNFTLNPTSCAQKSVDSTLGGGSGASAHPSASFQVGDCNKLAFAPKLALSLKGGTKRSDHPALKAVLTQLGGESGIAKATVTLPPSQFLENSHIKTICTRVQFAANQCPAGSVYGFAKATTPLLDKPLEGPVYLRSSSNKLPDLVADLNGQIHVVLVGRIDSVKARLRTTFDAVPDAPVSSFTLEMQGGKKGLLVNNRNLCNSTSRADVLFGGQNGKSADSRPTVAVAGCKKKAHKHGKGRK